MDLHTNYFNLMKTIVASDALHARWLNTLSFLENCGARKIAACEHPTLVKEEVLKHAAEEFRHAHHIKRQIEKVSKQPLKTYSRNLILGGFAASHYLNRLELKTYKYLKANGIDAAYLYVTYAIELRAKELYTLYDEVLRLKHSKVTIKSILLEEQEHLSEMIHGIEQIPSGFAHAEQIVAIEKALNKKWMNAVLEEISEITHCSKHGYCKKSCSIG